MKDLIKVKNASYVLYEELLMKRENLRKEGHQVQIAYLQVFGELLTASFRKKIECIQKKKKIAYCQRCQNQGLVIHSNELNRYIDAEMNEYEEQLKQMIQEAKHATEAKDISNAEVRKIKEIYYRLARKIHPDMRPECADNEQLMEYWNRIVIAYQNNHLSELEELELLVNSCLAGSDDQSEQLKIDHVEEKIHRLESDLERIISTTPYTYKFLLEDKQRTAEKKEELHQEIKEYEQYSMDLDEVLKGFVIQEMYA